LKKFCSRSERGFLAFWQGIVRGLILAAGCNRARNAAKTQKARFPAPLSPYGYSIFENALKQKPADVSLRVLKLLYAGLN
jgi:hypothetical protein